MFAMQESCVCKPERITDSSFDDFPSSTFIETAFKFVDSNKVAEFEHIDFERSLEKTIYQSIKRVVDIISRACAFIAYTKNLFFRSVYA